MYVESRHGTWRFLFCWFGTIFLRAKPTTVAMPRTMQAYSRESRDELLDREVFYTLLEVRVLTERYRRTYNRIRPHSSLGYRPPAPEALLPADPVPVLDGLT